MKPILTAASSRAAGRFFRVGAGFVPLVTVLLATLLGASAGAQSPPAKPAAPAAPRAAAGSGVDTVIALVKGGMSESLVIRTLKRENKVYSLSPTDLLALQKAGVTENIIEAMTDPGGGGGAAAAAAPAPAPAAAARSANRIAPPEAAGPSTAFPPDLAGTPGAGKRRLAVKAFDYSTVTNWVNYWFNNNTNIGEGIRAMLSVRLQQSKNITLLERANINDVLNEQDFGASNRVRKGSNARIGQLSGADALLMGDIVIFGRDDTTKNQRLGGVLRKFSPIAAGVATMNKEEKAVVGINLRLVDAETGEFIETAEARGESSRKSKDYAGILGGSAGAVGGSKGMTSSNFEATIIGEATSNAVTKIVEYLEGKVPALPAKARQIEGRVASVTTAGAILTVGSQDAVLRGDRFEVLKINGEIKDPTTKEVIDLDAVKVGELVVDNVRDRTASGLYGGQPLSGAYATTGKGYAARLISK